MTRKRKGETQETTGYSSGLTRIKEESEEKKSESAGSKSSGEDPGHFEFKEGGMIDQFKVGF